MFSIFLTSHLYFYVCTSSVSLLHSFTFFNGKARILSFFNIQLLKNHLMDLSCPLLLKIRSKKRWAWFRRQIKKFPVIRIMSNISITSFDFWIKSCFWDHGVSSNSSEMDFLCHLCLNVLWVFSPKNGWKSYSKQNASTKLFGSYCVGPWKTKTNYNKETEHDLQKVTRILTLFYNPLSQQFQVRRVSRDFTLHAHCTPVTSLLYL